MISSMAAPRETCYEKFTIIRCLNTDMSTVCVNNQPVMVKSTHSFFHNPHKSVSPNERFHISPYSCISVGGRPAHDWLQNLPYSLGLSPE